MSWIIKLPTDVSSTVFLQWLNLKDISKCDSALCNRTNRRQLLDLFSSEQFVLPNVTGQSQLNYTYTRKMSVKQLNLVFKTLPTREHQLKIHNPFKVRSLILRSTNDDSLNCYKAQLVNCCDHLDTLILLDSPLGSHFQKINPKILQNLCCFQSHRAFPCVESLEHLIQHCRSLTEVELNFDSRNFTADNIVSLALNNPNLKNIRLFSQFPVTIPAEALVAIYTHCKELKQLNISSCSNMIMPDIIALFKHCIHLELFSIHSNFTANSIEYYRNSFINSLEIHLVKQSNINEHELVAFFGTVKQFKKISLNVLSSLTSNVMRAIVTNNPNLLEFNARQCHELKTDDVLSLIQGCRFLKRIEIIECYEVDEVVVLAALLRDENMDLLFDYH